MKKKLVCIAGYIVATLTTFSQTTENPVTKEVIFPKISTLYNEIFDFGLYRDEHKRPTGKDLGWDKSFLDLKSWSKRPAGDWTRESGESIKYTEKKKYSSYKVYDFMGGPARIARISTCVKTGEILSIHVTWVGRNICRYLRPYNRDTEYFINFNNLVEAATKDLIDNLTIKFGKPRIVEVGKNIDFKVKALDFRTETGTTLRLYVDEGKSLKCENDPSGYKGFIMASIYPSATIQENEYAIVPKDERNGREKRAAANVVKSPNGDVSINNIPGHRSIECSPDYINAGTLIEYYGGNIPFEIFKLREGNNNQLNGALADANIQKQKTGVVLPIILKEIDAGRPVEAHMNTYFARSRYNSWMNLKSDPNSILPKESGGLEKIEADPVDRSNQAGILITGYNKEKEIIFMSWGSSSFPAKFNDFISNCQAITTYFPKEGVEVSALTLPATNVELVSVTGRKITVTVLSVAADKSSIVIRTADGKEMPVLTSTLDAATVEKLIGK